VIEDFLGGLLRDCDALAQAWRRRHPAGTDRVVARLGGWTLLARSLPANLDSLSTSTPPLDIQDWRHLWSMARGLQVVAELPLFPEPEIVPELVDRLHRALASKFDPADAFPGHAARIQVADWARKHARAAQGDFARAAAAALDFIAQSPLTGFNEEVAILLSALMTAGEEGPLVVPLTSAELSESGCRRALESGLDGDHGAWIAYWLAQTRIVLKRMPALADDIGHVRTRWIKLLAKAPFGEHGAEVLADALLALPVITPTFVEDCRVESAVLRDGLVLMFAADEAVELPMPGSLSATILPSALRLLNR
jgi:hypothetical protein